jgi:hypothetical protein
MAETVTAQQLFNDKIPEVLQKYPDKAREVGAIYGFEVTGDGGGQWTVDLLSDPPSCVQGDNGKAQCTIKIAVEDFNAMVANPQLGMQLYFQGKLIVTGDPMLATKLQKLIEMAKG